MEARTLVSIGDLVEDVVVWTDGIARAGTDNPARIHRARGGAAANVAVFAAGLGVPVRFIGRVGEDAAGDVLVRELATAGIEVRVQRGGRTGTIVILVDASGERTMYPDRAASADLTEVPHDWISGAAAVHLSAYGLTSPVLQQAADIAHAEGAIVTVDASSVAVIDALGAETFRALVNALQPTYLFANRAEADLGCLQQLAAPRTTVVVKNGLEPTEIHPGPLLVPVPPIGDVRDTTGAGDAFAAGFVSAVLDDAEIVEAVEAGHRLARRVLTQPGATLEEHL